MRLPRPLLAVLITALTLTGCGNVAKQQDDQQKVLTYEQQVGELNASFATPAATPKLALARLRTAVKRYGELSAPALMRSPQRRLMRALRAELASATRGLHALAAGDAAGIRRAEAARNRAERAVLAAVAGITARASRCRAALPACTPTGASPPG